MSQPGPSGSGNIRGYCDAEVPAVLRRLLASPEVVGGLAAFRFPRLYAALPPLTRALVRLWLRRRARHIRSVREFQASLEPLFEWLVENTTDGFTWSGIDRLDPALGHVYVSNHRDIALDPAFVNYALWLGGHDTVRIGIGDNLLRRWYATDLMRLNKSFVIPRSTLGGKAMYAAFRETSSYIYESVAEGQSVWIAQREGRAKDGMDRTDPAMVKMLQMSRRQSGESFAESIRALRIVPVSISYEIDPCDLAKARELSIIERYGRYEKIDDEDLQSIVNGIAGYKGRVHVAFGTPLTAEFDGADAVAVAIDRQILGAFRVYPTHMYAWHASGGSDSDLPPDWPPTEVTSRALTRFEARVSMCPQDYRPWLLAMYANPVRNRLAVLAEPTAESC